MLEEPGAELDVDAVGGVREEIGAHAAENDIEEREQAKTDRQHFEGRDAAMDQHLVDDDLEEKRRQQREDLDEERGQQDLAERPAIAPDRREEPAEAEATAKLVERRAARQQNDSAGPERDEIVAAEEIGPLGKPKSTYAVPGIYFYDGKGPELARELKPSDRGELEITALNNAYLERGELRVEVLSRATTWLDTGTHESLYEAGGLIRTLQHRTGLRIGDVEQIGRDQGWIVDD